MGELPTSFLKFFLVVFNKVLYFLRFLVVDILNLFILLQHHIVLVLKFLELFSHFLQILLSFLVLLLLFLTLSFRSIAVPQAMFFCLKLFNQSDFIFKVHCPLHNLFVLFLSPILLKISVDLTLFLLKLLIFFLFLDPHQFLLDFAELLCYLIEC